MNIITIKDINVKAVLLATFELQSENKRGILKKKPKYESKCLAFIPWKRRMKEVIIISSEKIEMINHLEGDCIVNKDEFISPFVEEKPYYCEFKIINFFGYDFVLNDKSFIANVIQCCIDKPLELLYEKMPKLLNLDLQID